VNKLADRPRIGTGRRLLSEIEILMKPGVYVLEIGAGRGERSCDTPLLRRSLRVGIVSRGFSSADETGGDSLLGPTCGL